MLATSVTVTPSTLSPGRLAAARCARLISVAAAVWLCAAWPAWRLSGVEGLQGLSIAGVLCTVPGLITFLLAAWVPEGSTQAVLLALGGTGLRLAFVLLGTLIVRSIAPQFQMREFLIWVVVYYLVLLLAETLLVVKSPEKPA